MKWLWLLLGMMIVMESTSSEVRFVTRDETDALREMDREMYQKAQSEQVDVIVSLFNERITIGREHLVSEKVDMAQALYVILRAFRAGHSVAYDLCAHGLHVDTLEQRSIRIFNHDQQQLCSIDLSNSIQLCQSQMRFVNEVAFLTEFPEELFHGNGTFCIDSPQQLYRPQNWEFVNRN